MLSVSTKFINNSVAQVTRRLFSTSTVRLSQYAQNENENYEGQETQQDEGQSQWNQEGDTQWDQQGQQPDQAPQYNAQYRRPMSKGINRVELLGGVGADPTVRETIRGTEFATFNLYTNVDRKMPNGDVITNVEVHNVIAFGGLARYIRSTLQKGSRIYLVGRLHYTGGQVLADGTRTPRLASINAENIYPLASRANPNNQYRRE